MVNLGRLEDGSIAWLTTGMLTVDDSISAEQLGLNNIDVQEVDFFLFGLQC